MSEFLSHVGDYNGVGFQRGVSLSRKLITSRADDEGADQGTFVDANIPVNSYLHAAKGVILQRQNAQLRTTGRDIPFHAFGYSNVEVQEAFEYPNRFTIITPSNPLWGDYDAFFRDIIIIGDASITAPGYYSYTLNTQVPDTVGVRWYTEGGGFEEDRSDSHHVGFVVTEDHWNMVTDEHELQIFCEINVPHLGKQTVLKKIVLEAHEPLVTEATPDLELSVLYPFEQFIPEVNNLAILSIYQSTDLHLHDATFLRWTITSGEKRKVLYNTVSTESTVNLILEELYDAEAPNDGPLTVSITVDILCGENVIATAATSRALLKPVKHKPLPPEVPAVARISSSIDLDYIRLSEGYFDLNADESSTSPNTEYWYRWRVTSTEVPEGYVLESTERNVLIPLRAVVLTDNFGDIPIDIELRVKSISNPKFVSTAKRKGMVIRPGSPESDPIARLTTDPEDISALKPVGAGKTDAIIISAPTAGTDDRYMYDYNYEVTGEYGVLNYSTSNKDQTYTVETATMLNPDGYDNVEVPIVLNIISKNDHRKTGTVTKTATYLRREEPVPVARMTTSPADLNGKTLPVSSLPLSFESGSSTLAPGVDYRYAWEIKTREKTYTKSTEDMISVPLSSFLDTEGLGPIDVTVKLTITSLRTLSKVSTTNIAFKVERPLELDPAAVITSPQQLDNLNIPKDTHIELSAATSAKDDRVDYTYSWAVKVVGRAPRVVAEGVNVTIPLEDFVDVEGFGNTSGTVSLKMVSTNDSSKLSTAAEIIVIKRRLEQEPVAVITSERDLMLISYNDKIFTLSAETSTIDPFFTLEEYACRWEILVGTEVKHTVNGTTVDIDPKVIGILALLDEQAFTARLTLTSPNGVLTSKDIEAGKVTFFEDKDYTPLFAGNTIPTSKQTIRNIQIPRWTVEDGTLSFEVMKPVIDNIGVIQNIISLTLDDKPLTIDLTGSNIEEYHVVLSDETLAPQVKVNGAVHDPDHPVMLSTGAVTSIEVSGKLLIDNLFGTSGEQYGFTGQLTNFVLTDAAGVDSRNYPLSKFTGSPATAGLTIEDTAEGAGDTHGIIHVVGGSTGPYWVVLSKGPSPTKSRIFAGTTEGNSSISLDGGASWLSLPKGLNAGDTPASKAAELTASSVSGDTIVVGMVDGWASISEDKGKTWQPLNQGLDTGGVVDVSALLGAGDVFLAATKGGFASRSTNKGEGWTRLPQGLFTGATNDTINCFAGISDYLVAGKDNGKAARSVDRGATWTDLKISTRTEHIVSAAVADNTFIVGCFSGYAYISEDRGVTWAALPQGLNCGQASVHLYALENYGDIFVAGTAQGYAAISLDKGKTWAPLPRYLNSGANAGQHIRSISSAEMPDGSVMFVAGFEDDFASRSLDGGKTWEKLSIGFGDTDVTTLSIVPKEYKEEVTPLPVKEPVIFGMPDGVAKVVQQGNESLAGEYATLPKGLNSGGTASDLFALAYSGDTVVAGHANGFASISKDRGKTWVALPRGLNSGTANGSCYALTASERTFVAGFSQGYASISTDKGATWETLPRGLNNGGSSFTNLTALASAGDTLVAGFSAGYASVSNDRGKNWTALPQGLHCGDPSAEIRVLSSSADTFVAGFSQGYASISSDAGKTWTALPRGLRSGDSYSSITALASSGDVFVAGVSQGYASISRDKGKNWNYLPRGLHSGGVAELLESITAYPNADGTSTFIAGFAKGFASISKDSGETWTALPTQSADINLVAAYVPPPPPPTLLAGMSDGSESRCEVGQETSTAEGEGWSPFDIGMGGKGVQTMASSGDNVVAVFARGGARLSEDRGKSWTDLPELLETGATGAATVIALAGAGDLFVAGSWQGTASRSTDRGKTWTTLPRGLSSGATTSDTCTALEISGDTIVAGFLKGYASISENKGTTWTALPKGLESPTSTSIHLKSLAASGNTFVAGFSQGYASISEDRGKTWAALPKGLNHGGGAVDNLALATIGGIFIAGFQTGYAAISRNTGKTWSALPRGLNSGTFTDIVTLETYPEGDRQCVVAGFKGGYSSISRDAGTTWERLPRGLNTGSLAKDVTAFCAVPKRAVAPPPLPTQSFEGTVADFTNGTYNKGFSMQFATFRLAINFPGAITPATFTFADAPVGSEIVSADGYIHGKVITGSDSFIEVQPDGQPMPPELQAAFGYPARFWVHPA